MKIAVLAWGPLVWDCRDLAVAGNFEPTGPRLPITTSGRVFDRLANWGGGC